LSFNKPFELLLPLRRLTDELDALTRSFSTVSRKLVKVRFSSLARARAYAKLRVNSNCYGLLHVLRLPEEAYCGSTL
jgi:hypothetical protein